MADNKKYYYIKLKENFFETEEMIVLESAPDGHKYSNILLKIYLKSLKHDGKVMLNERIPYNSTMLASVTRHSVGDVEKAVKMFKELGLIETFDNGTIFISDIQNFIGRSSTEAERKKEYRERIKNESLMISGQMSGQTSDVSTPEIELELEKELEIDKEIELEKESDNDHVKLKHDDIPYFEIISYLNQRANKKFKPATAKYRTLIKSRWNEGQRLDDFKKVVDNMVAEWTGEKFSDGKPAENYLQPSTLFGPKFDQYLNTVSKKSTKEVNPYEEQLGF